LLIYRRPAGSDGPFEEVGRSVRRVDGKGKLTYEQIAREDLFS